MSGLIPDILSFKHLVFWLIRTGRVKHATQVATESMLNVLRSLNMVTDPAPEILKTLISQWLLTGDANTIYEFWKTTYGGHDLSFKVNMEVKINAFLGKFDVVHKMITRVQKDGLFAY